MFKKATIHDDGETATVLHKNGKAMMKFHKKDHDNSYAGKAHMWLQQNYHDCMSEGKDSHEYDYEGEMSLNQLKQMEHHIGELKSMLKPDTNLPEWVQLKITLACDYIQTAADYLSGEMKEEAEQIAEMGGDQHYSDTKGATSRGAKGTPVTADKMKKDANKILTGAMKKLDEARGRPPKEGSEAWKKAQQQANDEMVSLGAQIRKSKTINKPVRFMDGKEHHVSSNHADRFEDHMAARRTTQEKAAFQKEAHKSHADFVKAVSAPVPKASKDTGEVIKYR
jgi:hypothetical protein